ncbi:MAG: GEVED domain-containing protein [Candidatus Zixiibacteriota bacterium]
MKIYISNLRGAKLISLVMIIIVFCAARLSAQTEYCEVGGGCDEYISFVSVNYFMNNSGCGGYEDYTNFEITVRRLEALEVYLEISNAYANDNVGVWIDWNQDFDFDDPNEVIGMAVGPGPHTFLSQVPSDAVYGRTHLRLRLCFNETPFPCGITEFGEVEDYAIEVEPSYVCGDANNDRAFGLGDAVFLINYIFKGGAPPPNMAAGDPNCDGRVNIGDAVYMIDYIFRGGPAPCCP